MTRKTLAICGILIVLLVSTFGAASAQDGTTPEPTPVVDPTEEAPPAGARFFTHPVVQLLSAYFDREKEGADLPTDPDALLDENGEGEESESGLGPIGEQIAAYHEQGMGFGVLVKIFAMAEAIQAACPDQPAEGDSPEAGCQAVSADELVTTFKSGGGMGALFKTYGKPALMGVGHVKKELKKLETNQSQGEGKGKAKGKDKPPKENPNKDKKKQPGSP